MAKTCEELDLIAEWDEDKKTFKLRCKTNTRVPLASDACGEYSAQSTVDINQVAAEMASGTGGQSE